jgi:gamma-glutamylcyclotransferase (GGCT)/AIG2-like uncharacterized protein YtfP
MAMNPRLFVYGSLIRASTHLKAQQLRAEADFLGTGAMQGQLFRVSWYPAMIEAGDPQSLVHGEVYQLHDPEVSLLWLDAYEGIQPGRASVSDCDVYERVIRPIRMDSGSGQELDCWLYLYRSSVESFERIETGRWQL